MGREVRRVPKDWKHPTKAIWGKGGPERVLMPLFPAHRYAAALADWERNVAERGIQGAIEWDGMPPDRRDYMPDWKPEEATHWMMYEDTTEGTPLSPAFPTPEELAHWLVEHGSSAFGEQTATYEEWLSMCRQGLAPSAVMSINADGAVVMESGVAYVARKE